MSVPDITLNDGVEIPQLGFGVFQVPPEDTAEIVALAFEVGYRHIDTAAAYRNEEQVGEAVRASGLARDEVFITTKCFNTNHGRDRAKEACRRSLDRLGLDFIDLYLIHWPVPMRGLYVETWEAFVELRDEGVVRSIGVSNFNPPHLQQVVDRTGVVPSVNQVELHPWFQQRALREEHARLGIVTEAWSPLARGRLGDPALTEIAQAYERTVAQVLLRWHLQLGNVVIPKSATPERIRENFDVFGFSLSDADLERIGAIDRGERIGPDPETFDLP